MAASRPCCCECCCGFKGCIVAIGIILLILASISLVWWACVFGVAVFASNHHFDDPSAKAWVIAICGLILAIAAFEFIINVLLLVSACNKSRCLVLTWFWGSIAILILIAVLTILCFITIYIGFAICCILWIGLYCYFLWVGWEWAQQCH